jgi:pSer/pThr/pTyr-binding forkhead associated (FHA) protein
MRQYYACPTDPGGQGAGRIIGASRFFMNVVMVMFKGSDERRSFAISRDVTLIGRREDCDFRIPLGDISRKHCRLVVEGDVLRVQDLGSSNGTFVNGKRVQDAVLSAGDTLQVGPITFVLRLNGQPPENELIPVTAGSRSTAPPTPATPATSATDDGEFDPMSILASDVEGSGIRMLEDDDLDEISDSRPQTG